jgi:hypothetical protein
LALIVHIADAASVANLVGLLISLFAIVTAAWYCSAQDSPAGWNARIYSALWAMLLLSLIVSIFLTSISWPTAPDYYPWAAFFSEARLLLISGENVGHSPVLWLIAFVAAFYLYRAVSGSMPVAVTYSVLIILVVSMLATKSRLALVFVALLVVQWLASKGLRGARVTLVALPIVFSGVFFYLALDDKANHALQIGLGAVQASIGSWVRITPSVGNRVEAFAHRDILTKRLREESAEKPFVGLGHGAAVLKYGIDRHGKITSREAHRVASSESPLRLAVKYGWIYFAAVLIFVISAPYFFRQLPALERDPWITVWGMSLISVTTNGGMENYYGMSGFFLFMLVLPMFVAYRSWRDRGCRRTWFT